MQRKTIILLTIAAGLLLVIGLTAMLLRGGSANNTQTGAIVCSAESRAHVDVCVDDMAGLSAEEAAGVAREAGIDINILEQDVDGCLDHNRYRIPTLYLVQSSGEIVRTACTYYGDV